MAQTRRAHRPKPTPPLAAADLAALTAAELHLRAAGRLLELEPDLEWQRMARVVFRLAQLVGGDSGLLERAA